MSTVALLHSAHAYAPGQMQAETMILYNFYLVQAPTPSYVRTITQKHFKMSVFNTNGHLSQLVDFRTWCLNYKLQAAVSA